MKLYSYVVRRDFGFAPNPFYGICSLATCKPILRRVAQIGDWVVGLGSKSDLRHEHVVYAMRVTEALSFEDYWSDPRFQVKKPNLRGSKKQAFGDNIYSRNKATGRWNQANSHHSLANGDPNPTNVSADTGTDRILLSNQFVYWGGTGPKLPKRFLSQNDGHVTLVVGRNHKTDFPDAFVKDFISWINAQDDIGYSGLPRDWRKTA